MSYPTLGHIPKRIQPGPSLQERNIWNLYLEIAYFGFVYGILQTFLNVYAIRLGANNAVVGLLNSAQPLVFAIGAIPAARLFERTRRHMRFILVSTSFYRLGVAALGLMPVFLQDHRPEAVVVIVLLMSIPQVMSNIAFSSMFADVVPGELRPRVVAVRNTLLGLTSTVATFLGGQYLGLSLPSLGSPLASLFTFPLNYQLLLLAGFLLSMIGVIYLSRIRLSGGPAIPRASREPGGKPVLERIRAFVQMMRREREFSRYTLVVFIFYWGLYLPTPLYSLFWVRTLNASDSYIGLILTVQSITTMIVYPLLPRLDRRLGTRGLVALSTLLTSLYPLATAFVTSLEPLLFISVLGGVGGAMFNLSSFNLLLEVSPNERRPSYIATFNTAAFAAGCIAPFVGTALLDAIDIRLDLLIGFALRIAGTLAFLILVGTSSKAKASTV